MSGTRYFIKKAYQLGYKQALSGVGLAMDVASQLSDIGPAVQKHEIEEAALDEYMKIVPKKDVDAIKIVYSATFGKSPSRATIRNKIRDSEGFAKYKKSLFEPAGKTR